MSFIQPGKRISDTYQAKLEWKLQFRASNHANSRSRMNDFQQSFNNHNGPRFILLRSREGRVAGVYVSKNITPENASKIIIDGGVFIAAFGVNHDKVLNANQKNSKYVPKSIWRPWSPTYYYRTVNFGGNDDNALDLSIAWDDWKNTPSKSYLGSYFSGESDTAFSLFGKPEFFLEDYEVYELTLTIKKERLVKHYV